MKRGLVCAGFICALLALPAGASAATITVNITADELASGGAGCSLREAVTSVDQGSNADDCVAVGSYTSPNEIDLPAGAYNLTRAGLDTTNVNGDLDVTPSGSTLIKSTGGTATIHQTTGDRVLETATPGVNLELRGLTLTGGNIDSDTPSFTSHRGGGIDFESSGGSLLLNGTTVSGNNAANGTGGEADGGGIYATSPVTLQASSVVSGNTAAPGVEVVAVGGGIFAGGPLTVTDSSVTGNHSGLNSDDGGTGGGIEASSNVTLTNATIDGNSVGYAGSGAGLEVKGSGKTLTLTGGSVSNNIVHGQDGGGGGISLGGGTTGTLTNTYIDGNTVGDGADANGFGAGILASGAALTVSGTEISSNVVGAATSNPGGAQGGGIYANNGVALTITDSTLVNDEALGLLAGQGGGIEAANVGAMSISGSQISGNVATNQGGGIQDASETGSGAHTITDTTIDGNSAQRGGGIDDFAGSHPLTIERSTISNNQVVTNTTGGGGGIASLRGSAPLTVFNSTITGNSAVGTGTPTGGGLYLTQDVTATADTVLSHDTIASNSSTGAGGNIWAGAPTHHLSVRASIVTAGAAAGDGNNCHQSTPGVIVSAGYNLSSVSGGCGFFGTGDDVDTAGTGIGLGALANNGGPTKTMSISPTGIAADRETTGCSLAVDQRGDERGTANDPACDTGAFEVQRPDTQIDTGPTEGDTIGDSTPAFTFTSPGNAGAAFQCRIDPPTPGTPFTTCPGSFNFADGAHEVDVRAVFPAGDPDPTPVVRTFTVDTTPPGATIDSILVTGHNATTSFSSPDADAASFACSVDGAASAPCTSPEAFTGLAVGPHSFSVTATDATGNTNPSATTQAFLVAPDTSISAIAVDGQNATATFSSPDDLAATFTCSLDGGAATACTSPKVFSGLAPGSHTLAVAASEGLGNTDATPATQSFSIAAPVVTPPPIVKPVIKKCPKKKAKKRAAAAKKKKCKKSKK